MDLLVEGIRVVNIEQRILRLAGAATEEWPASGGIPVGEIDDETGTARLGDKTTALLVALSAPTLSRLARVVSIGRALDTTLVAFRKATKAQDVVRLAIEAMVLDEIEPAFRGSLRALDADAPEGGP